METHVVFLQEELLYLAQGHWGWGVKPKRWVEGLREGGDERIQVGHCVRGDAVEWQNASWPVQENSYSPGFREPDR